MHPILDKAEVVIDFPDKFYMGSFGRDSSFKARSEADGVLIRLVRATGEKRAAEMHLHYFLLAAILDELAASLPASPAIDDAHRKPLAEAAQRLAAVLESSSTPAVSSSS
jgi:hypothetical protein